MFDEKLQQRIIGAFTFKKEVYADVEQDASFTQTAWLIVAVVALLGQLGGFSSGFLSGLLGIILGTAFQIGGFALGAWVVSFMGQKLFKADVNFQEMVRTLGLAYVWQIIGFLGAIASYIGPLACLLVPIILVGVVATIAAWLIAAKEALDLEWGETVITVVVGFVAVLIVSFIATAILGALGVGAATMMGAQ